VSALAFTVVGARADPYAAAPTVVFRLRIDDSAGRQIHAMTLRAQVQIEPRQRHYDGDEQVGLLDLFDVPRRWGETLRNLLWTQAALNVPGFTGSTEVELPIACTYDFDVAASKYLRALAGGEVPLLFLWSGTAFVRTETGFAVEPVPWHLESPFRLPVAAWREAIDGHFPGTAWLRLRRDVVDALYHFKARRALPTFEDALHALLDAAGEGVAREEALPVVNQERIDA